MSTLGIILLAIIAYLLWRIYRQPEDEKSDATIATFQSEREQEQNDLKNKYPEFCRYPYYPITIEAMAAAMANVSRIGFIVS